MRVFAHKLALFAAPALLCLLAPAALAHPHHPAKTKSRETRSTHSAKKTDNERLHHRHKTPPPPPQSVNPVSSKRHKSSRPSREIARISPIESETIRTHHNRKLHHAPTPELAATKSPIVLKFVPPMKGSHEILIHQNLMADSDGLIRIEDEEDLELMRSNKSLVAIPDTLGLQSDDRLPSNRRYCRPWTAQFLTTMAHAHYARFHSSLQVNSAVRTIEFQQKLLRINGNAAPAEGDTASPHLTGQAVDIAKHGLTATEIAWIRGYLLPLVQQGKIDVEEEFQQACFHISVYRRYVPQPAVPRNIAQNHHVAAEALATAMR